MADLTLLAHSTLTETLASYAYNLDQVGNRRVLTETLVTVDSLPGGAYLEADGLVVLEAEHGDRTNGATHTWLLQTSQSGYTGTSYLQPLPDLDQLYQTGEITGSPKADYLVNFTTPATYTVWLRGYPANAAGDSVYVEVSDEMVEVTGFGPGEWSWASLTLASAPATVPITASGIYTVSLWMREDGLRIDRLLLTTDTGYIPPGFGPAETTRLVEDLILTSTLTRTIVYTYDNLYRLTEADYTSGENYQYSYDPVGNRLQQIINGDTTEYLYDAANRLAQLNGQAVYSFDANGNMLSSDVLTNTWDAANRLTQTQRESTILQPIYNGVGDRVGQTVGITTTHFALDVAGGLPEVIYTSEGKVYLHLPGVIVAESNTGETRYLLSDGLGSIRQAVDETGTVVAYSEFDPWGNPVQNGSEPYGFTGEWWQDDVELLHLRARWYAPQTGTFLSRDALATMPVYHYVSNNPVNRVDPSGYIDWASCIIGIDVASCMLESGDTIWGVAREILHQQGNPNAYDKTNSIVNQHIDGVMVPIIWKLNPHLHSSTAWNCPACSIYNPAGNINLPPSWVKGFLATPIPPPTPFRTPTPVPTPGLVPLPSGCNSCGQSLQQLPPIVRKIGPIDIIAFPSGHPDLKFPWKHPGLAQDLTVLGAVLDFIEIATVYYPTIPEITAGVDFVVAGGGSILAGETYYAQPHPSLPRMAVVGQDLLVAGVDTAIGSGGKAALIASAAGVGATTGNPPLAMGLAISGYALDTGTSTVQAIYDTARAFGAPTVISLGVYTEGGWPRMAVMLYCPFE